MKNKDFIIKFKDNAELAMASYGYFDRLQWNIEANNNIQIKKRMEKFRTQYAKLHNLDIKKRQSYYPKYRSYAFGYFKCRIQ